ncbi:MAG TPA: DUF2231 domain-containing protein [Actinomycetales bacterium]|nr:DUF2231 domain-containing protein [Actinomycetales bacterium]
MFDTIAGLPLHPLVVHAVVVGIPVMSLVTVAVAVRRPPQVWLWLVVAANTGLLAITAVAKEAGQELEDRVGEEAVAVHSELGEKMPYFVVGLLFASLLVALVRRREGLGRLVLVVAVVAAVAAVVWVVRVGDSGSRAVWEELVEFTNEQ